MDDRLTDLPPHIRLRTATEQDRDFLESIYASTRADELALTDWSDEQKRAFARMQFEAQDAYYREHYEGARFLVIEEKGVGVGRLYLCRMDDEIRVMDIALLPAFRGRGVGTKLIQSVIDEARAERLAVRLHVEPWNPAHRLYERLGFRTVSVGQVYELMELAPADEPSDQLKTAS